MGDTRDKDSVVSSHLVVDLRTPDRISKWSDTCARTTIQAAPHVSTLIEYAGKT